MKTYTKSIALFFAALVLSLNTFATGVDFDQEEYIDDIPFNVEDVITQLSMEKALTVDFSLTEEEYVNDIPADILSQESLIKYKEAVSQDFNLQEEAYIDDIPNSIAVQTNYNNVAVAR